MIHSFLRLILVRGNSLCFSLEYRFFRLGHAGCSGCQLSGFSSHICCLIAEQQIYWCLAALGSKSLLIDNWSVFMSSGPELIANGQIDSFSCLWRPSLCLFVRQLAFPYFSVVLIVLLICYQTWADQYLSAWQSKIVENAYLLDWLSLWLLMEIPQYFCVAESFYFCFWIGYRLLPSIFQLIGKHVTEWLSEHYWRMGGRASLEQWSASKGIAATFCRANQWTKERHYE